MNKKILIGVVLGVAIAIPLYLYLSALSNTMSNPKISLRFWGLVTSEQYEWHADIHVYHINETLYNCKARVEWLAINGSWLTKTQTLGIVDVKDEPRIIRFTLEGFQSKDNFNFGIGFPDVGLQQPKMFKVEVYGYLKP